ncbi:MBL fold metallo-hydrolase [Leucobacter weissii]|uniref:MBL fold metallo-hydrolase n=1 Tax=Leucobacter weissii TaxID=1983706 RepID=A0A939MI05_9MICO|nr:MBL fold metallo-hydrolase [Leucobacter weissii]MBO1901103.1 MBL fold metallo-hydrolase [Leucobacter weissii]
MRCFRLSHAGLVVEDSEASLFVDPGDFSSPDELAASIAAATPIAGIVITHEHADHWTPAHLTALRVASPRAPVFTTRSTAAALDAAGIADVRVVREGERIQAGPFSLDFYGGRHEPLHSSIPVIDNIGVRVNETVAWGGDSLVRPPFAAEVLGVPIGSPWSSIAQVMDFVLNAAPRRAFLTHDGMLSVRGLGLFAARVRWCLDQVGGELVELPRLDGDPTARTAL